MTVRTRHPIKIAQTTFPPETLVTIAQPDHPFLQENFPGLKFRAGSSYIAVFFPHRPTPTIVDRSQLVLPELPREVRE